MKSVILSLFLLGAATAASFTESAYQTAFTAWMQKFDRVYTMEEFTNRYAIFKANMDFVEKHNSEGHSFEVELNQFADISNREYQLIYLGTPITVDPFTVEAETVSAVLADDVDWRTKNKVTKIKDQGQCGSCWSFSTTGSVEGAHAIKTGNLVSLSEQNLMDCSTSYGNAGCNGGLMDAAFKYIIANKGIDTEASYPYTMKKEACAFKAADVGATISSYKDIAKGSESGLTSAIQQQPVSVAIDASHNSFQLYKTGVYHETACSATRLDHGVLAVGYGSSGSDEYYIVKNSWGTTWGQEGYIWMSRNKDNNCGIATSASYPIA